MEFNFRTSGTTGDPKKVIVSDSAIEARLSVYVEIKNQGWFPQGDKAEIIDGELYIYGRKS